MGQPWTRRFVNPIVWRDRPPRRCQVRGRGQVRLGNPAVEGYPGRAGAARVRPGPGRAELLSGRDRAPEVVIFNDGSGWLSATNDVVQGADDVRSPKKLFGSVSLKTASGGVNVNVTTCELVT